MPTSPGDERRERLQPAAERVEELHLVRFSRLLSRCRPAARGSPGEPRLRHRLSARSRASPQPAHRELAAQAAQVVDEQDAVEVVDLVAERAGEEALRLDLERLAAKAAAPPPAPRAAARSAR